MRDRGSALVLTVLVATAIIAASLTALVPVLDGLIDRQRARSAADAAALAGVTGGQREAAAYAERNGGVLVAWYRTGRTVTVTVSVGDQHATARATDDP